MTHPPFPNLNVARFPILPNLSVARCALRVERFLLLLFLSFAALSAAADTGAWDARPVRLDLFFSPGCPECERVEREVLPDVEDRFGELCEIVRHDISRAENLPLLLAYQRRFGASGRVRVSVAVDREALVSGHRAMATGLCDRVDEALARRQEPGREPPPHLAEASPLEAREAALGAASSLTFWVVAAGGLADGFNPCAVSTLIFFLSLLAVSGAPRRARLLLGVSFVAASFLTYTAVGLGLLSLARAAPAFPAVRRAAEAALGLAMLPLAALSFRDAARFRRSGSPADVALKIPSGIKRAIHAFMDGRLRAGGPVAGGLAAGAGVTVLESVCTGQGYLPTLAYIVKSGAAPARVWALLITYNILFTLPLAAVFACFHRGARLQSLIGWSRRNLAAAKVLLGLFFAAMAILLLAP